MTEWVTQKNIERFRQLLARETDIDKRRILKILLAQEEETLRREAGDDRRC